MGRKKVKQPPLSKFDKIYLRDGGYCWICGMWGPVIAFNRDHLIPKSLGGSDGMWNLRIAHPSCNSKRDRMPPSIEVVLLYCTNVDMIERARCMYYRAYPHLKGSAKLNGKQPQVERGKRRPAKTLATVTDAPDGHKRYRSQVCSFCGAWCSTCMTCWCHAYENGHDVLRIRGVNLEVGVNTSS